MNERIRELVEQCYEKHQLLGTYEFNKEKFAESIIEECAKICDQRVEQYKYETDPWAHEHIAEAKYLASAIREIK